MGKNITQTSHSFNSKEFRARMSELITEYEIKDVKALEKVLEDYINGKVDKDALEFELNDALDIGLSQAVMLADDIIRELSAKADAETKAALPDLTEAIGNTEKLLKEVVSQVQSAAGIRIDKKEDVLQRRFKNVIFSWIRDVRDDLQVLETAARETRVGGLGFDEKRHRVFFRL